MAEPGAAAAGDLAMDDGRAEILLGSVVGRRDVRAVEVDERAGAVRAIPELEAARFTSGPVGHLGKDGPEDQVVDGVLDAASATSEQVRGERLAEIMQMDRPPEQVAQFAGPDPSGVAIGLDGVGQVADLVRQADLVALRGDLELRHPQVRDSAVRTRVSQERRDHLRRAEAEFQTGLLQDPDALVDERREVASVPLLQIRQAPVVATDRAPAR
jgi:hypothetical protein